MISWFRKLRNNYLVHFNIHLILQNIMQKINLTIFKITFISLLFFTFFNGIGQEREAIKTSSNENKPTLKIKQQTINKSTSRATISLSDIRKKNSRSLLSKGDIDTLNFPLTGEYTYYLTDEGGYVSGNNSYNDKAKAEYFVINEAKKVTGILIDFVLATGDSDIELAIWDNSGDDGSPGSEIYNTNISISQVISDVQNNVTTFVEFENAIIVNDNFYTGVKLPTNEGDTVVIWTNTHEDTNPATAWEQWSDNTWVPFDDENSWQLSISHAIFPIVENEVGLVADFTSNTSSVLPGQNIEFSDNSSGNPLSWEWTFEGGYPTTSTEQNPVVLYADAGLFDVSLKISDGSNSSSITKADYIIVSEAPEPQIDTLNFPLPGNFAVYVDNNVGGYVCGTNGYYDRAKANYFSNDETLKVTGLLIDFYLAQGGNSSIEVRVWDNDGPNNGPGSLLGNKNISFDEINNNINNQQLSFVEFDNPISINHSFYAGFMLPTIEAETLVVWSNEDGDTYPGIAWEMWEDNSWHPFSNPLTWQLNLAMGIHPIVDYTVGINDKVASNKIGISPNPSDGIIYLETDILTKGSKVRIYNTAGESVFESVINSYSPDYKIDLSGFRNGMCIISVTSGQDIFFNKIVKN